MIDSIIGWFGITQYDDKCVISIDNLVETTWLERYPCQIEIAYYQGLEFIGNSYRKYLIEKEYRISANPRTFGNPTYNAILEQILTVLGYLVRTYYIKYTYIDIDDPWLGILAAT